MVSTRLFADRYEPRTPLGQGALGVVWRAFDVNQHMEVALKLYKSGASVIHKFHEARVLTALEGEHMLRVYNADTDPADIPFIATRIANAGSSEDFLVTSSPFGVRPEVAITWVRHMLVGLGSCHALGLVHRDIKTQNIFLDRPDWAMLGDFGIAYPVDVNGRVPEGGTPVTKAPEMIQHGYGTYLSDIYSTGATMYRLLTGSWPFNGATESELYSVVLEGSYVPVRDAAPHVSRRLAARVERAMSLSEGDRYESWRDLHDALGHSKLVSRSWKRIGAHANHRYCWVESGSRSNHRVCVWKVGSHYEIETRRLTAAGSRVTNHCGNARNDRALLIFLRRVFDTL